MADPAPDACVTKPGQRLRSAVHFYIAKRRLELKSHPAINEACKKIGLESGCSRGLVRRTSSCDFRSSRPPVVFDFAHDDLRDFAVARADPNADLAAVYEDAAAERESFKAALREYEKTVPQAAQTKVIVDGVHTWQEVISAVRAIKDEHYQVVGFRENFLRKLGRVFTDSSESAIKWTEMLPSDSEYFSVICCSLKLIFGAASRLRKIREDICHALEHIPDVISRANTTIGVFEKYGLPKGSKLHDANARLMESLLALLHRIVFELNKSFIKKNFTCFFKQERYGETLDDARNLVLSRTAKLEQTAGDCMRTAQLDTRDRVIGLQQYGQRARQESREMHTWIAQRVVGYAHEQIARLENLQVGEEKNKDALSELHRLQLEAKARSEQDSAIVRRLESDFTTQQQVLVAVLQEIFPKFIASTERIDGHSGNVNAYNEEQRRITFCNSRRQDFLRAQDLANEIIESFGSGPDGCSHDLRVKLNSSAHMEKKALDHAAALTRHPKLQKWATQATSGALFVNDRCHFPISKSPISLVSARLVAMINETDSMAHAAGYTTSALAFFCAEHTHQDDPERGPCGLLRSFIAQLLASFTEFDLAMLRDLQSIDCEDFEELRSSFVAMAKSLPSKSALFLIIDGIDAFESRSQYQYDATRLISCLVELATPLHPSASTKVLFSSLSRGLSLQRHFNEADILTLPEKVPAQNHHSTTINFGG